jgi:DNA polymerase alpha subunit A
MLDGSASSPMASDIAMIDEDDFVLPVEDEPALPLDEPMSDPAPSSPAAKVAERRTQPKMDADQYDDDDDDDMMEVAHAGAVAATSVNLSASRQIKKIIKAEPLPTPVS